METKVPIPTDTTLLDENTSNTMSRRLFLKSNHGNTIGMTEISHMLELFCFLLFFFLFLLEGSDFSNQILY